MLDAKGSTGNVTINASGDGDDTIYGGNGADTIYISPGGTLYAGNGTETIYDNSLFGGSTINAGSGNDTINLSAGIGDIINSDGGGSLLINVGSYDGSTVNVSGGEVELTGGNYMGEQTEIETINFTNGGGITLLKLDQPLKFAGTIYGFSSGDVIDLTSVGYHSGGFGYYFYDNDLEFLNGISLQFDPSQNFSGEHFEFSQDGSGTDITLGGDSWASAISANWSSATVWSAGAAPTSTDTVRIAGTGTFTVTLDVVATVASLILSDSAATLNLDGYTLTVSDTITVTGGTIGVNGILQVATVALAGGSGTITVEGTASTLSASFLSIGGTSTEAGGQASLTIASGAKVSADDVQIWSTGTVTLAGGELDTDPITLAAGGRMSGNGTVTGDVTADGTITASGGRLDLAADITGGGTLTFDSGATLELDGAVAATESLVFTGTEETLIIGPDADVQSTISGIGIGDKIVLEGQQVASAVYDTTSNQLAITGSSGTVFDLTLSGTYAQNYFSVTDGELDAPPCFLTGTRILTARGGIRVEELAIGDLVRAQGAGLTPITWIGHRRIDCRRHPKPQDVWPIRIEANAFGTGLPQRPLFLSPDHAVFAGGALIPVKLLVNGVTIRREERQEVTYWHVELARHDVILAEGLPCESYLDTGNRAMFAGGGAAMLLHPEFKAHAWDDTCHPMAMEGEALIAVRESLFAQAGRLGYARHEEPEPRLRIGNRVAKPSRCDGNRYVFTLPRGKRTVRLVSDAGVPAERLPFSWDRRQLGLSLDRITVSHRNDRRDIALDDPALRDGWHAVERDGGYAWRWTDGNAGLELSGPCELEITVVGTLPRWTPPAAKRRRPTTQAARADQRRAQQWQSAV